jgi:hypothetical protein
MRVRASSTRPERWPQTRIPRQSQGELRAEEQLQVGPITQYATSLVKTDDELPQPHPGLGHTAG